ncbi:hypothetical protein FQN49_005239 [Arthroderma sp. PD_2]|nr:hypothetical protein FQN49_005239 [Arthroderma sp. PD_2]
MPKKLIRPAPTLGGYPTELPVDPNRELKDSLASLRKDPEYSDLMIICRSYTFLAHKCIVCPRSEYFAKVCHSRFREGISGKIELHNDEPVLVEKVLDYLYTLDYEAEALETPADRLSNDEALEPYTVSATVEAISDPPSAPAAPALDPLSFHIQLYSLADRLFIHSLKFLSRQKAELELFRRLNCDTFALAVIEIYNSTPEYDRGLRDMIVRMTAEHLVTLRRDAEAWPRIQDDIFKKVPEFTRDLLLGMIDRSLGRSGIRL